MAAPVVLPDWASGTNYTSGPTSGNPNKSQPSAGMVTEGFEPKAPLAAEHLNYLLNNHAAWIDYLYTLDPPTNVRIDGIIGRNALLYDDFTGDTVDQGIWKAPTINVALFDDSAGGAFGALRIDAITTGGARFIKTENLHIGTADFRLTFIVRDTSGGGGAILAGLASSTAAFTLQLEQRNINASPANWYVKVGTIGTGIDTGIAVTVGYQYLEFIRTAGVVKTYINGVLVNTAAYAGTVVPANIIMQSNDSGGGSGYFFIDMVKFWINK